MYCSIGGSDFSVLLLYDRQDVRSGKLAPTCTFISLSLGLALTNVYSWSQGKRGHDSTRKNIFCSRVLEAKLRNTVPVWWLCCEREGWREDTKQVRSSKCYSFKINLIGD
jgi:hypothetical protein